MRETVPLRRIARLRVEPAAMSGPAVTLDLVESGSGRLIGSAPESPADGQNRFRPGDVLFSKLRPYLAKSLRVQTEVHGTGEFLCMVPEPSIDERFLFYTTLSRPWLDHAGMTSYGTKMPRTSWEAMAAFQLPVLSIDEQRRIASFLDDQIVRIDAVLDARERQSRLLGSAYDSFISHRIDTLASKHGFVPLRRLAADIEQGWSPAAESTPAQGDAPGVVRLGAVRAGEFIPAENKAFPDGVEPNDLYRLYAGDLLITRANTPELVGDAAAVQIDASQRLYLSDLIYRVHLSGADPLFASAAVRAARTRQELATLARGTSRSMAKLRSDDVLNLQLPAAPLTVQSALGAEDERAREELKHRRADLTRFREHVQELKQSLITAAVSGEFDVTTASARHVLA